MLSLRHVVRTVLCALNPQWKQEHAVPESLEGRSRGLSRAGVLLAAACMLGLAPHCTFEGLDAYSAEYGKSSGTGGDGGGTGSSGGAGGGVPDGSPGCDCAPGQECVLGQCETCTPTWSYDHKALRQGDIIILQQLFDPGRKALYVASSRQDGQGPRRGYLAEVSTCRGTLLKDFDHPKALDGTMVTGLHAMGRHGDSLFAKLQLGVTGPKLAGYAVYDMAKGVFERTVEFEPWIQNAGHQGAWTMDVAQSGKVWMLGDYSTMSSPNSIPLVMQSDGLGTNCVFDYSTIVGNGRAMTTKNDDVYLTVPVLSPTPQIRVMHYNDSACNVSSCNCPMADELPPLDTPFAASPLVAKVVGSVLVVAGFYVVADTDWVAFVAQYNFATNAWSGLYTYDPSPLVDGVGAIASDGSKLYAGVFENHNFDDPSNTKMEVLVFGFPITPGSQPQKIPVPALRAAFGLDLDGDGMLLSGYSASSLADGRSVRCTLDACP